MADGRRLMTKNTRVRHSNGAPFAMLGWDSTAAEF